MAEKMKDGIIRRGSTYSYVVRSKVAVLDVDPLTGEQRLDGQGRPMTKLQSRPRWVGGFPTRAAAKRARDEARNAVNQGTYVAPQDMTVGVWLDTWILDHRMELKPSTAKSYEDKIRVYLKPAIGAHRVQELSPQMLSGVWRTMQETGGKGGKSVSVRTVEFARAVLRKAMADAVVNRIVQVNPVIGSKMPKRDGKPKHTTWTGAQLRAWLEHDLVQADRWVSLWELAAATGVRRGEIAGLRWEHVDLEAGTVGVEYSTTQLGQERVTTTPKNHERRTVAIDTHAVAVLKAWRTKQAAERLQQGPAWVDADGLVFTWENGAPILPDYITKTFGRLQKLVAAADVDATSAPLITFHELRHTHATMLLRAGVPVHIVAKRLGHKDPSVTLNVYADVIPDDDTSAVDIYSKAVWGA